MTEKARVIDYLERCYSGARMLDDAEMLCRLSRALIAFCWDDLESEPDWERMQQAYLNQQEGL